LRAVAKGFPVLLACAALLLAACGGGSKNTTSPAETKATATATAAATTAANGCKNVDRPDGKADQLPKPTEKLDRGKTYVATVSTTCGDFQITLDSKRAPKTGGSFKYMADNHLYDGTTFHRIVPGFVIQGGDPTATGSGGPGYTTVDPPPASARYTHGVVATAKAQTEPAGTSGSQFFVVTARDAGLPPDYAILGRVVSGLDVVDRIGRLGDQATEQPTQVVEIERATVAER
jgi:peptidyl-prolyl cis-trans isomerase B (cyclophilin B)